MQLTLEDLTEYGRAVFEEIYAARPGRETDGKKHQDRESVAYGFIACLVRHRLFTAYFKPDVLEQLRVQS